MSDADKIWIGGQWLWKKPLQQRIMIIVTNLRPKKAKNIVQMCRCSTLKIWCEEKGWQGDDRKNEWDSTAHKVIQEEGLGNGSKHFGLQSGPKKSTQCHGSKAQTSGKSKSTEKQKNWIGRKTWKWVGIQIQNDLVHCKHYTAQVLYLDITKPGFKKNLAMS